MFSNGEHPCRLYVAAPVTTRPYGVDIPVVDCICRCVQSHKTKRWLLKYESHHKPPAKLSKPAKEVFLFYVTSCCKFEMSLAIFKGGIEVLEKHGSRVVRIEVDRNGRKLFNRLDMTCFKFSVSGRV